MYVKSAAGGYLPAKREINLQVICVKSDYLWSQPIPGLVGINGYMDIIKCMSCVVLCCVVCHC